MKCGLFRKGSCRSFYQMMCVTANLIICFFCVVDTGLSLGLVLKNKMNAKFHSQIFDLSSFCWIGGGEARFVSRNCVFFCACRKQSPFLTLEGRSVLESEIFVTQNPDRDPYSHMTSFLTAGHPTGLGGGVKPIHPPALFSALGPRYSL